VRAVILGGIRERAGARYAPAANAPAPADETRVLVRIDLRPEGMAHSETTLLCVGAEAEHLPGGRVELTMSTTRARIRDARDLQVLLTLELDVAARAECPLSRVNLARREAEEKLARLGEAAREALRGKDTTANALATRQLQTGTVSRDDATVQTRAAAGDAAVRLEAMPDTLRLLVGQRLAMRGTHRVRAVRADGTEMDDFVPFYTIASREVVQLSGGAFVGVSAGTTRVTVRPLPSHGVWATGVETSFIVQVVP